MGCFHFKDNVCFTILHGAYGLLFDTEMMLEEHDLHDGLHGGASWGLLTEQDRHSCN